MMVGYSVAGFALYGASLERFGSLYLSSLELLRILMLDFEYSYMYQVDPTMSALFFVVFMVMIVTIITFIDS